MILSVLAGCAGTQQVSPIFDHRASTVLASQSISQVTNTTPIAEAVAVESDKLSELIHFIEDGNPPNRAKLNAPKVLDLPKPPQYSAEDLKCLSRVMYFEARGEGRKGMLAVGHVVMNRVADDRFPDSICGVVKQGKHHSSGLPVKHMCQFSWYCDGIPDKVYDKDTYEEAATLAKSILTGSSVNPVSRSLYFHTTAVRPKWSRVFARTARVGNHIFYYA